MKTSKNTSLVLNSPNSRTITIKSFAQDVINAFSKAPLSRFPHAVAFELAEAVGLEITCSGMDKETFQKQAKTLLEDLSPKLDVLTIKLGKQRIKLDWVDDQKLEII